MTAIARLRWALGVVGVGAVVAVVAHAGSGCGGSDALPAAAAPTAPPLENNDGEGPEEDEPEGDGEPPPIATMDAGTGAGDIPSKIRYVMVLVKENHTFDNYFSGFPGAESATTGTLSTNKKTPIAVAPNGPLPSDLCHSNVCGQKAYADGGLNGFDLNGKGTAPFVHYTEKQIPNYWQYARNFVLADHFFSTSLAPSTPGHTVFWAGHSLSIANAKCIKEGGDCAGRGCQAGADVRIASFDAEACTTKTVKPCFDVPSVVDKLPPKFTWTNYGGAISLMVKSVAALPDSKTHYRSGTLLASDLAAGRLANLTIAHLSSGEESEHPPNNPCKGENSTVDIINAAMKLPQWKEMAIVLTWDDWGGFYDHVRQPVTKCKDGQVMQGGFRLPAIVISAYAKKGFILSSNTEQASVPRLIAELWGMEFMTARDKSARDGVAGSMMAAFDFDQPPREPLTLAKHTCP